MKHIVMLFTDQQRRDTIGAFGNDIMQTPNLDALVRDSVVFDQCYTPSPVCVPARLSMLSGQYPARTGCNTNNAEHSYHGTGFYDQLTKAGFDSTCIGKMHHLIDPYGPMGFCRRFTQEEIADPADDYLNYVMERYPHIYDHHGMRSEMYYVPQISQLPAKDHPTQWIGDRSVECIENHDPDQPLFLVSSFIHPHPPFNPPAPWQKLYRDDPNPPFIPEEEAMTDIIDLIGPRCSCDRLQMSRQDVLRMRNFYYACVSFVDYQVGRIVQALKDKGIYDDTLILFSTDHGDMMGDYNATGKRTMVDPSCHIPMIIHYPGMEAGHREDPCSLVDIAPTMMAFAGVKAPEGEFDGIDLFGSQKHDVVYSQFGGGKAAVYMVTDGKTKLVYQTKTGRYFYFETQPETKDTYDPANPRVQELQALLDAYRASDCNTETESISTEPVTKTHPHYPARMDHHLRREAEAAAIPAGYHIDLD